MASLIQRLVDGSDRPIGFAFSYPYVALAALSPGDAEEAREAMSGDIVESARWRRRKLPDNRRSISGQGDA